MSEKYTVVKEVYCSDWINKPENGGYVGGLQEICDELNQLLRERDEAREKIKRQAERICQLEGATNHAGGLRG